MDKVSDVYKELFHYTDFNGVNGILKTQSIWATHFKFLNDRKEILLAMENILPNVFYPHLKKKYEQLVSENPHIKDRLDSEDQCLESIIQHDLHEAVLKSLYEPLNDQIYIASFCGESTDFVNENGLLSQWRGYGGDGGFCLIFDTEEFEKIIAEEYNKFAYGYTSLCDVIYENNMEKLEDELSEGNSKMIDFFNHMVERMFRDQDPDPDIKAPYSEFLNCISRIKHQGFEEEKEVRLVTHIPSELHLMDEENRPRKPVLFRGFIPYVEMFESSKASLPIKRIIVGPHVEQSQRVAYLKTLLINTNIDVTPSEIPYTG